MAGAIDLARPARDLTRLGRRTGDLEAPAI
jgi:hypothetical protein